MADKLVMAEIAGVVFSIDVAVGDKVAADDALCTIESMKMHIPLEAPVAGVVVEVMVAEGDAVAEGQVLFKLAT